MLELAVGDDDYGKVIGRGGRTANALRTVVKAAAAQARTGSVLVDIVGLRADRAQVAAGRVGRPHGLDGSFHVADARPHLLLEGDA